MIWSPGWGANEWKIRPCSDICGSANLAEPKGRTGGQGEDSNVVLYAAAWSCPVIHRLRHETMKLSRDANLGTASPTKGAGGRWSTTFVDRHIEQVWFTTWLTHQDPVGVAGLGKHLKGVMAGAGAVN